MLLWWKLKPETMAKLIQFQYGKYGTRLDLMMAKPPHGTLDISPDTQQQMTDETNKEMSENSDIKEKIQ